MEEIHIGSLIKQRLEDINMSQGELARQMATTPQNVSRIVKSPTLDSGQIEKIGKILKYDFFKRLEKPVDVVEDSAMAYHTKLFPSITVQLDGSKEQLRKTFKMLEKMNEVVRMTAV